MATHDYVIANQGFPAFRTDLNNALAAIVSNNSNGSSPSAPTTTSSTGSPPLSAGRQLTRSSTAFVRPVLTPPPSGAASSGTNSPSPVVPSKLPLLVSVPSPSTQPRPSYSQLLRPPRSSHLASTSPAYFVSSPSVS